MSGPPLQNQPPDPSDQFAQQTSHFFIPASTTAFDAAKGTGEMHWKPMSLRQRISCEFTDRFRVAAELRYRLLPYLYTQATLAASEGHPLLRPLFFEHPDDPTSWFVDDQFFCGGDLLVAPLFEDAPDRRVYLPPGDWVDYQSGDRHRGPSWVRIAVGDVPIVVLARSRAPSRRHGSFRAPPSSTGRTWS